LLGKLQLTPCSLEKKEGVEIQIYDDVDLDKIDQKTRMIDSANLKAHTVRFHDYQRLHEFNADEKKMPLWPLAIHAAYAQVINPDGKESDNKDEANRCKALLENDHQRLDCGGKGMDTLCDFGDFLKRITGDYMVAVNVFENMGSQDLQNLVDPLLKTVNFYHVVSAWDTLTQHQKIITNYEGGEVTYYKTDPQAKPQTQNAFDIIQPASKGEYDSTFFLLPLRQMSPPPPPSPSEATSTSIVSTSAVGDTLPTSAGAG
jgi:hypothetical protein